MTITNKKSELESKVAEIKVFLQDVNNSKVNGYIDNLFPNLNINQRKFLKRLTKSVLYLLKEF